MSPDRPPLSRTIPDPGTETETRLDDSVPGAATTLPPDASEDTLVRGRVTLWQPRQGFRSSLDPVLLAAFIKPPYGRFVDIGCGTGALGFLLCSADEAAVGVGVEIQERLARLAAGGLARNRFAARLQIVHDDVRGRAGRAPLDYASFDLVATNPPYRPVSAGVPSPHPERAQANHEVSLTLDQWLLVATLLVKPQGRIAAVFPADRVDELLAGLRRCRWNAARVRLVQPRADRPASRVLIEARVGDGKPVLIREPPLVLHDADGTYTSEMRTTLGEV